MNIPHDHCISMSLNFNLKVTEHCMFFCLSTYQSALVHRKKENILAITYIFHFVQMFCTFCKMFCYDSFQCQLLFAC